MRKPKKHTIWSRVRRAGRRLRKLNEADITTGGLGVKLRLDFMNEPLETRKGINPEDRNPFYESDEDTLKKYYHGYNNSTPFLNHMLYADLVPFECDGLEAVDGAAVKASSVKINLQKRDYLLPSFLKNHQEAALDILIKQDRIVWDDEKKVRENDRTPRLIADPKDGVFNCQSARYFDQVATNLTVDWASGLLPESCVTIRTDSERPREAKHTPSGEARLPHTIDDAYFVLRSHEKG